jgi:hypothetical protein
LIARVKIRSYMFFALLPFLAGCAWRTDRADYLIGPTLFRFRKTPSDSAMLCQTIQFPVRLEGGRQWGLTLGGAQRFAVAPFARRFDTNSAVAESIAPSGIGIRAKPNQWQWSWIFLRAPMHHPIFVHRSDLGFHTGIGAEERAIQLGYSSVTGTQPGVEGIYDLEFSSREPLRTKFVFTPVTEIGRTNTPTSNEK